MKQSTDTVCALCQAQAPLQMSHILPAFVFDWLRRTSPTFVRRTGTPNRRVQDGLKVRLLCAECELLFSGWEKAFAEGVFAPYHAIHEGGYDLPYDGSCLRFCVSVSWRVLHRQRAAGGLQHFSSDQHSLADRALTSWKQFLQGEAPHPGSFEQHLVPVHLITQANGMPWLSPYINRYFMRSTDQDVLCSDTFATVYAKLGRLLLFGFIQSPSPSEWRNSRVHVRTGRLQAGEPKLLFYVLRHLSERANRSAWAMAQKSGRQKEVVADAMRAASGSVLASETRMAVEQDLRLFGARAFETPTAPLSSPRRIEDPDDG